MPTTSLRLKMGHTHNALLVSWDIVSQFPV